VRQRQVEGGCEGRVGDICESDRVSSAFHWV
jgi:hypothetical protein